jgi:hypothetical protein
VDGHDARRKCGIITEANVEGSRLLVAGYVFAKDFPDVERQMRQSAAGSMGMSWELADAHVEDMRQDVWTLTRATFTGAAILLREKAAYRDTSFELSASRCRSFAAHATSHPREGLPSRTTDRRKESTWNHQRAKEGTR